jgi:signal transduction histidine kinase
LEVASQQCDDSLVMNERTARRLAWGLVTLALLFMVVGNAVRLLSDAGGSPDFLFVFIGLVFGVVGALIASRRPANPIGWIFVAVAIGLGLIGVAEDVLSVLGEPTSVPARVSAWLGGWTWVPLVFVPTTFPLLLFPDGHTPSPRWRWLMWAAAIGILSFAFSMAFDPSNYQEWERVHGEPNPLGIQPPRLLVEALSVGSILLMAALIGSGLAVAVRLRRSRGEERQQLKWLAYTGVVAAACVAGAFVVGAILAALGRTEREGDSVTIFMNAMIIVAVVAIPVAMGLAILRYRLYDIDVVIKKTLVFGILVLLIMVAGTGLVLIAGGPLTAIAPSGNRPLWFAGLVQGLLVLPLYKLSRRIADRVVYRGRSSPYQVMSEFAGRMSVTYATEDALPRLAAVLGEGTGAERSIVWLRIGDGFRAEAVWPSGAGVPPMISPDAVEVIHQGEVLGALSVQMPANDPMNPTKEKIVRDLAGQAGLVLRNVRLIEDLRESRRRIVSAQDERARKLERDIHDGAQQQLVALAVRAKLAQSLVTKEPAKAAPILAEMQAGIMESLEDLRDLARGIYPPLLADQGLPAALEAQARKSPVPVSVDPDGVGRYPQEIEAAIYFSVLEALQNVAKYSKASSVTVMLAGQEGDLTFEVTDDGSGFDPAAVSSGSGLQGMADRLAAIGGVLEVRSAPGDGTTVAGRVPTETSS